MQISDLSSRGVVVLGGGKMGMAMMAGWIARGVPPGSIHVIDPAPSDALRALGVRLDALPQDPAVVVLAVKPQIMAQALPQVARYAGGAAVFLSVAAGITLTALEAALGGTSPIVRAMPNTPSAVGRGITALIGNAACDDAALDLAEMLMRAVGQTVRLQEEAQMDAVTGVSGSGPAYVFHMIECLAEAGQAQGLSAELALELARATVAGAGVLAQEAGESPAQLRQNVTSPNGTTQAGLEVLMHPDTGLPPLIRATVAAAADRSRELGRG